MTCSLKRVQLLSLVDSAWRETQKKKKNITSHSKITQNHTIKIQSQNRESKTSKVIYLSMFIVLTQEREEIKGKFIC